MVVLAGGSGSGGNGGGDPTWGQADIVFFSASDRGFSENFGLKTRISASLYMARFYCVRLAASHMHVIMLLRLTFLVKKGWD